jgi:cation:H+ antiporter
VTALTALVLLGGLVLLAAGGEVLVRGAKQIASALGLSSLVIGITVVSFATSAPELAVTLGATLSGNPGLAIGNVVGSNIANVLLILGVCAVITPLAVRSQLVRLDIPVVIVMSALVLLLAADRGISRLDGALLLAALVVYIVVTITIGRRRRWHAPADVERDSIEQASDVEEDGTRPGAAGRPNMPGELPAGGEEGGAGGKRPVMALGLVAIGVAMLVGGANLLVSGATDVASAFGVSDLVVGLSVVAIGTSLPELAASLVALLRGERDLAVGNIVGSCLFNIGAVLGLTAVIASDGIPVADAAVRLDLPVMIAAAMALAPVAFTGFTVARWEGALFVAFYVAYVAYVLLDATGHDAVEPLSGVMLGFVIPITVLWLAVLAAYELGLRRGRSQAGR